MLMIRLKQALDQATFDASIIKEKYQ